MKRLKGTPIAELVDGGRLKSTDILLEHSRSNFWGWLIRLGTGNYWNHALMVCSVSGTGKDDDKTLIIDPRMGGIYTIDMCDYLERFKNCDISVKRFEANWFQGDSTTCETSFPKMVSDFALRRMNDTTVVAYPLGSIKRKLRKLSIIYRFISRKRKSIRLRKTVRTTKPLNINTYACSGVVQWSYYRGVEKIITEERLDRRKLQDVIFSPTLVGNFNDGDLLCITPADLARCDKLTWKYIVKDSIVWEVSKEEEVESIIRSKKS